MTTPWMPAYEWAGETVAVLGAGPSMSQAVANSLRDQRVIVVNETRLLAPWADMLVHLDAHWTADDRAFAGMKVTALPDPGLDALAYGVRWQKVNDPVRGSIEIHNSGLAAIRIAADMGAARIVLAGFDPGQRGHFEGHPGGYQAEGEPYTGLTAGLEQLCMQLRARGIEVTRL